MKKKVVFQLPVFKESKDDAEKMVAKIKQLPWIVAARVEDLSKLPLSIDNRIRIQITFEAEEKDNFYKQLKKLSDILNDVNVIDRVYNVIDELNINFSDLIAKKEYLIGPLTSEKLINLYIYGTYFS